MKKRKSTKRKVALAVAAGLAYLPIGVVLELAKKYGGGTSRRRRR